MKPGAKPAAAVQRATDWLQRHLKRPQVSKINGLMVMMMMIMVMMLMVMIVMMIMVMMMMVMMVQRAKNWFQRHLKRPQVTKTGSFNFILIIIFSYGLMIFSDYGL